MVVLEINAPIKPKLSQQQQQETKPIAKTKQKKKVSFEELLNIAMGKN
jgi:hypothetical protein